MTVYLDASVLLRVVLSQPDALPEWREIRVAVTSGLTEVECLRTLDRRRRLGLLTDRDLSDRRHLTLRILENVHRVDLSPAVLRRAAEPFPTPLGTLDALHLATALLWGHAAGALPVLATHDTELGTAGRAVGLSTLG